MANGAVMAGVAAALVAGGVAAYVLTSGGGSGDLGNGAAAPAAAPGAPALAPTTQPALPAAPAPSGSGAVLANEEAHYPTPAEIAAKANITEAPDYVCGKKVPIDTEVEHVMDGVKYKFCSAECRDKFIADPGQYLDGYMPK